MNWDALSHEEKMNSLLRQYGQAVVTRDSAQIANEEWVEEWAIKIEKLNMESPADTKPKSPEEIRSMRTIAALEAHKSEHEWRKSGLASWERGLMPECIEFCTNCLSYSMKPDDNEKGWVRCIERGCRRKARMA